MKASVAVIVGIIACVASASAAAGPEPAAASLAKFKDASVPVDVRVNDLISHMTLEEKAGQLGHTAPAIPRLGCGLRAGTAGR